MLSKAAKLLKMIPNFSGFTGGRPLQPTDGGHRPPLHQAGWNKRSTFNAQRLTKSHFQVSGRKPAARGHLRLFAI
jgi:hypothetical protein